MRCETLERRERCGARLACGLALLLSTVSVPALAQAPRFDALSPVTGQPDNPGAGQETGPDGLPSLRRGGLSDGLPRAGANSLSSGGESGGAGLAPVNPTRAGLARSSLSTLETRVRTSTGRVGVNSGLGAGIGTGLNTGPASVLVRQRAAPSRRLGSATRSVTQQATQTPTLDLRLSPVIQNAVVGVPLPQQTAPPLLLRPSSPILGLLTPGLLLASTLRETISPLDPAYVPLGIKLGSFTVLPAFSQGFGYDTNPDQIRKELAKGSVVSRTELELAFRSDWSASELAGQLRGAYLEFPQNDAASRPSADGAVSLRIDATRDLRFDVEGRFVVDSQRTGSVDLQAATTATSRPLIATYGTTLGVTEAFNRLSVSLRGSVDRSEFEDAQLSGGAVFRQSDRNQNQYGLRLRTAYELSPTISPFVDVLADTRVYDLRRDSTGLQRDSDGVGVTAGASFNLTRFLTGEISAGMQHRSYVDRSLKPIEAPLLNASLIWQASPLTSVRLGSVTAVTETTLPGSSGVITKATTLEVQHDLLRNLSVVVGGAYLTNDYQGSTIHDTGFSATARLDYRFTRWLTLRGTYLYQQIDSSVSGASFRDNTFLLGLRVNP